MTCPRSPRPHAPRRPREARSPYEHRSYGDRASRGRRGACGRGLRGHVMASVSAPDFWTDLYARGGDGWEIRQPAPPLVEFVDLTPPAPGRVAVPGCGRGHDVRFL